ncbi:hypothetical protein SERLA73DRAFT_177212 [Serpula lacrymans var. lacrymans S7.3]|uniref:Uncharacterized protein n=2 Tax=Serpula lacrymans var. lacrymans TaxID=341189 RepID=F8PNL7_SERL3|nr:uncharacterized protein SERLADRAFT_460691 [Serpula lacrymans var. lacrymans S7.9]EGO01744.1 hypothetical protein SERLA73DRAFT_177212 [Serpula lacrymans var. lacrymans S7.3]EGO27382.1 hypothetical protein SERLADRAFT_460691 [Serpula lacrymans var. lacrymans S7.9]
MATAPPPNPRASLLNGLRTGGVRSVSMNMPHTAAPGSSFNLPRFASNSIQHPVYPEEEDIDEVAELFSHHLYTNNTAGKHPLTAAVDGPNNRFIQQQHSSAQRGLNPNSVPFNPSFSQSVQAPSAPDAQTQVLQQQMQMMQLEIMRLQNVQVQQTQAALLAEAMRQQINQNRRNSSNFNPPATAGPLNTAFDLRSVASSAQSRRANQTELLKAQLGISTAPTNGDQVPMTAALGGKFGSRPSSNVAFPRAEIHEITPKNSSPPPSQTTVISGGTSLGSLSSNSVVNSGNVSGNGTPPSKSDSATSWRRGGNNNSVLNGQRTVSISVSPPSVTVTPPPGDRPSPTALHPGKARPRPLSFAGTLSRPLPVVAVDTSADGSEPEDAYSTASASSQSNPTTPHSSSSIDAPLSPREEASKKLYEGLGIGRPVPVVAAPQVHPSVASYRMASQPMRQPRGPPSGSDELGPKNFATRIRRKAIGGLGVLMGARERREAVEAY